MKLLGKDVSSEKVMAYVQARLSSRGLAASEAVENHVEEVEGRVDPLTFNLNALETHSDTTRGLPIETHRGGLSGQAVRLAKVIFRRAGQVLINEALGRQVVFNGHVRDSYAQLSAEVIELRKRLAALEKRPGASAVRKAKK